eukprot:CAMPEP_0117673908 /NCGR_PEP_ID=MMETSP0804-20121206/14741_1 /TAXON_ID=1074897 /ORGANISM="Tetraselmis astigmatica, Strain CCMP880" /LENGTH=60 /DNA_ID=CAMNT_0005482713 /DNA_START=152 /DNA_END=330 /DNA_ORIENTATION=-
MPTSKIFSNMRKRKQRQSKSYSKTCNSANPQVPGTLSNKKGAVWNGVVQELTGSEHRGAV